MSEVSMNIVIGQLLSVLQEAFEGPQNPWSYFTDKGEDAGLFNTLGKLSAAEASHSWGGTTIAAHAHHVAFSLEASTAWIKGDKTPRDWQESWRVSAIDDKSWSDMIGQLHSTYNNLQQAIKSNASSSVEAMGGALAAIAHAAYHLGAIRQKIAYSREY